MELKDRAIAAREAAGFSTVPPWATKLGISSAAVYQIESGKTTTLKAETCANMARLSGLSADWLRTGKGPKQGSGEASQSAGRQREIVGLAVRVVDHVRDMALDPIPDDMQAELLYAAMVEIQEAHAVAGATEAARSKAVDAKLDAIAARDRDGQESALRAERAALDANDLAIRLDRELAMADEACSRR